MSVDVSVETIERKGEAPIVTAWSNYIPVLDKGFIRLEAALASDLDPVNAARVSFNGRSNLHHVDCPATNSGDPKDPANKCNCIDGEDIREVLAPADRGLINFLARERHGTPFEHSCFRWEVKAPLFVFREWHRHRVGNSYNEQSGRYMQLEREFYVPARDQVREQYGKPGNYKYRRIEDDEQAAAVQQSIRDASNASFDRYEEMLEQGIAKEVARVVLPVNTYSTMWWTDNPRSLMAFLSLRNAENAQWEIQQYAKVAEEVFIQTMPVTAKAFVEHGRKTP